MKNLIAQYSYLSEKDIKVLESIGVRKTFKKSDIILDVDTVSKYLFIVEKGILCGYHFTEDLDERVLFLIHDNQPLMSSNTFINTHDKNRYVFQAITELSTYRFDFYLLEEYASKNPGIFRFYSDAIKAMLQTFINRIEGFAYANAEERYQKLIENKQLATDHILDKYMAQFLGITPTSFSRLKRKIKKK